MRLKRSLAFLELIWGFLASLSFYQTYHRFPSLPLGHTHHLLSVFLFLRLRALWEKVKDHVLSLLKVCVSFRWVIAATQGCFSPSDTYWVISGYNTLQQIPHLCSSNYIHSSQSFDCPPLRIFGKQWPELRLRRSGLTLSELFFSVKWDSWTRWWPRFHCSTPSNIRLYLLFNLAKMDASNMACPLFLFSFFSENITVLISKYFLFWFFWFRKH